MEVLGLSGISNRLVGEEGSPPPNHEEVLEAGRILVPRLETIIRGVLSWVQLLSSGGSPSAHSSKAVSR